MTPLQEMKRMAVIENDRARRSWGRTSTSPNMAAAEERKLRILRLLSDGTPRTTKDIAEILKACPKSCRSMMQTLKRNGFLEYDPIYRQGLWSIAKEKAQ